MEADLSGAVWLKASRSSDNGGECVEVAVLGAPGTGHRAISPSLRVLRDSKDPDGPKLFFTHSGWAEFVAGVKHGEFDS
ncbi:DUF397 domain-containing protein [Streptosporangium sp. NPDC051022]|uniref:DUF397 domain-containing protein n=1 Tax=Streptosporangium sp. NPDC051022 TaxID=3155752 RepID=UPI003448AE9D